MKKINLILVFILTSIIVNSQATPVKIVFDVTSSDTKIHKSTLRHVNAMAKNYPDSEFEVVVYSGALEMVLKEKSCVGDQIEKFANNKNVSFVVCAATMKHHEVDETGLLDGVKHVPDGILEIVAKQSAGWGYIKEAN